MRRHLDRVIERQLNQCGLSSAEFELLGPLSESPQGYRARDLGAMVGWDRSRIAHLLRRMEQRELVERTECPDDARGTIVTITDAGRELLRSAAPGHVATVREFFVDQLDEDERTVLANISVRVRDHLLDTDD